MIEGDYTVVPIVDSFTNQQVIGELRVLTSALPARPDFVFSIAFMGTIAKEVNSEFTYFGAYELHQAAIASDEEYIAYLRQIGKLKT